MKKGVNVLQKQHSVQHTVHKSVTRMPGSLSTCVSQLSTHPVRRQSQHRTDGTRSQLNANGAVFSFTLLVRHGPRPRGRFRDSVRQCKLSREPQTASRWVTEDTRGCVCGGVIEHLECSLNLFRTLQIDLSMTE